MGIGKLMTKPDGKIHGIENKVIYVVDSQVNFYV